MGKITDELLALIAKQVEDHGLVVRYDPARHYADIAETLGLPRTTVLHFTGSFFELRARLEPFVEFVGEDGEWLRDERTERAVVYVPLDRGTTRHALVEAEQAGKVIEPGADHWQRNSRLKVIAERVLRGAAPGRAATIAAEIEAGRWSLAELDRFRPSAVGLRLRRPIARPGGFLHHQDDFAERLFRDNRFVAFLRRKKTRHEIGRRCAAASAGWRRSGCGGSS